MNVTIIGFIAALCTTTSFLPQAYKTLKTKKTKDISLPTYLILSFGVFLWTIYGFYIKDMPIFVANGLTLLFVLPILFTKIQHG